MNTIPLRAVCVGRLLVDLPKRGTFQWSQDFDQAGITRLPDTIDSSVKFWSLVEDEVSSFKALHHKTENGRLRKFEKIGQNAAILFYRGDEFQDEVVETRRYVWIGDKGYKFQSGTEFNKVMSDIGQYSYIFSHLSSTNNFSSTGEPGFCIDGALVKGAVGKISVGTTVEGFGWKNVSVDVGTSEGNEAPGPNDSPITTPFEDLQEAEKESNDTKGPDSGDLKTFKVLVRQERTAGGFKGQMTGYRKTFNNGRYEYRYDWQAEIKGASTSEHPRIAAGMIFLDQGPNENPNIPPPSEDQMLGLFNAVLDSVRLRPGAI